MLNRLLSVRGEVEDWWAPRLVVESDELADYLHLPNYLGARLCSSRMRDVTDANLGPDDRVQWLPSDVVDILDTSHDFSVLHLPGDHDVLNESRSIMVREAVVKPVVDAEKMKGRRLFGLPKARLTTFVSDELRTKLAGAAITGVDFEAAATARSPG